MFPSRIEFPIYLALEARLINSGKLRPRCGSKYLVPQCTILTLELKQLEAQFVLFM
jgi:hypothetical protein